MASFHVVSRSEAHHTAFLPPSRVVASAATTAASSSPEAATPLKADLELLAPAPLISGEPPPPPRLHPVQTQPPRWCASPVPRPTSPPGSSSSSSTAATPSAPRSPHALPLLLLVAAAVAPQRPPAMHRLQGADASKWDAGVLRLQREQLMRRRRRRRAQEAVRGHERLRRRLCRRCQVHPLRADPKKTLHLQALDGSKDRLHLFKASL